MTDTIGFIAGLLTTFAFLPQVISIIKTKNVQGISLGMYLIFSLGVALWLFYGLLLQAIPIIATNAVTLFLALIILYLKWKYSHD